MRSHVQNAMGLDALESSHPISVTVDHPDEINEIFDEIVYSKGIAHSYFKKYCFIIEVISCLLLSGASIIRMLEKFLGANTFRQALTNYLIAQYVFF